MTGTKTELRTLAESSGFQVAEVQGGSLTELPPQVSQVVLFGPHPDADALVGKYPQIPFLAFGAGSLKSAANLTVSQTGSLSADQVDFLAGYVAAVITTHWRVAVITGPEPGAADRFARGAVFFCGLCSNPYPPFEKYPLRFQVSGEGDIPAIIDKIGQAQVKTVYIAPGADSAALYETLAKAGANIISTQRRPDGLQDNWVVSLQAGGGATPLDVTWKAFLDQSAPAAQTSGPVFQDINATLFSPGREMLVESVVRDLEAGKVTPDEGLLAGGTPGDEGISADDGTTTDEGTSAGDGTSAGAPAGEAPQNETPQAENPAVETPAVETPAG